MDYIRLYLLRHGETQAGEGFPLNGWTDIGLSDRGRAQLEDAARTLADVPFDRVISSDLSRARYGGALLAGNASRGHEIDPAWREMNFGDCEGMPYLRVKEAYPEIDLAIRNIANQEVSFPGGESVRDFSARVAEAVSRLVRDTRAGRVALVSHCGTGRAVLSKLFGIPYAVTSSFHQSHAGLHVVDVFPDGGRYLRALNLYLGPEGYSSPGPGLDFLREM
ncbi:MAG: histidine phosphatase family protein [Deltaproteobacteria bacterium]|jgi:broad specificity phosphatase PhoE|nr:histidine phosphatase family protein [Deltaproteobacteria bacterium]